MNLNLAFGQTVEVEPAGGGRSPIWPLPDVTRRRWTFGASRSKGKRKHAGLDLYAPRGSVVLSPEQGEVVAFQDFNGPLAVAMLIQLDSGPVVLLGEIEPRSWREFGLSKGSRVEAGQPVARVGINPGGDQMLHYEMYRDGTRRNQSWPAGNPVPSNLLDPTEYLKRARALDVGQQDPKIEDDPGNGGTDPHDHEDPIGPDIVPPLIPNAGGDPDWRQLALIVLAAIVLGKLVKR